MPANMKLLSKILLSIGLLIIVFGCSSPITRFEQDVYTITEVDTTRFYEQTNAPGNRDNGMIFPSSRTFITERDLIQRDSVVNRDYPNFIRIGLFEGIGLINGFDKGYGAGLFGIFPEFSGDNSLSFSEQDNYVFAGGIYRFGIGEWRLRWFRDAPDWTIGTYGMEIIAPNSEIENTLVSAAPIYLKKRWYLRREIPYIAITASGGLGYYPSQYINLSGSLDIGSIGGLNLKAYLGLAFGQNNPGTPQMIAADKKDRPNSVTMPYLGISASFLEFANLVPETETEWRFHEHSGWNIGLLQFTAIGSSSERSIFTQQIEYDEQGNELPDNSLVKGFIFKLANSYLSLPFIHQNLYAGTSLLNVIMLGYSEWGVGIAPIRLGWWQTVIQDELSAEPFIEMNYYPSTIIHIGGRVSIRLVQSLNIGISMGYASGRTDKGFGSDIQNEIGRATEFSGYYIGINLGFFDRIFFPEELRYNR
jgi:hypothetical protein